MRASVFVLIVVAQFAIIQPPLLAQVTLPIEFDEVAHWTAKPGWLSNPAAKPVLRVEDGIAEFRVTQPGKGMKWLVDVERFHPMQSGFLLVRYRAENLNRGAGYFLWVSDAAKGGHEIVPLSALRDDGRWHVLAVDLWAARVTGSVRAFALQVAARYSGVKGEAPASVWLDYIRYADEMPPAVPERADRYPKGVPKAMQWQEDFDSPQEWQSHVGWLGNPDPTATLAGERGAVLMTVPTAGRGMKWSRRYDVSVDLSDARYVAIRYRAENIARHGDYFVWVGSEPGGMPQRSAKLMQLGEVEDDGAWHVYTGPVSLPNDERFKLAEMAVQVQADAPNGRAWIDYVRFAGRRPLVPIEDSVAHAEGFRELRLGLGSFLTVGLASAANVNIRSRLKAMGLSSWFDGAKITVEGIPFALETGERNIVATPRAEIKPVWIPVGERAREAYLLIAAVLPPEDLSGVLGGRPLHRFSEPERFVARIRYRDGAEDLQFPVRVRTGRYEMVRGVGVYCLPELRAVPVERIGLECRMPSGCMMLAGVTLNTAEPVTPRPPVSVIPPPVPERPVRSRKPRVEVGTSGFTIETGTFLASFEVKRGVTLSSLRNKCLAGEDRRGTRLSSGSFFELGAGDTVLTSDQLTVSGLRREGDAVVMELDGRPRVPLSGTLRIAAEDTGEIVMSLDVRNVSDRVLKPVVNFPAFSRVVLGDVDNTWYFYARQGGIISNIPTVQRRPYSGRYPLQVTGLFNPQLGGGMYLIVRDISMDNGAIYKYYVTDKNDEGVDWRIEYFPREYAPAERIEVAETALSGHTGDWRAQLAAYRRWTRSWYRPLVPRKDWFRDIYNYRQHLVRGGLYDFDRKQYRMTEVVEKDRDFFGRIDYFHIFDFGQSDRYGRVGDYCHYDEIGGLEKLAAAIAGVKASGVPVGVYIEGYLCDERGLWGREHVAEGHIIKKDGQPLLWNGAPTEHMMCPQSEVWQEHLERVYRRVAGELGPSGMYIDQHGFGNEWKICWSRRHGHPVPWPPIRGERELGRRIRDAVPPEIATLGEEVPTDVNSQVQDGALGYSVAFNDPRLAPHRVDLFRFVFPDFKVIQLVAYNDFVAGGWAKLKFPFFNAEAVWLGNRIPGGFEPAAQAFLRRAFRILHEHREAFRSEEPRPLVPTESPLIYANEFPGRNETVWTLFNADYRTYRGPVLSVRHVRNATYRDLWKDRDSEPELRGGRASLSLEIGPREVGCVAQITRRTRRVGPAAPAERH